MKKLIVLLVVISSLIYSQDEKVGIDEKLGNFMPLELEFQKSNGDTVKLSNVFNKPTLLALVYYQCPGICNPLQNELAWVIDKVELDPGEDFQVVSLSIDHEETPKIAAKWKKNYLHGIKRKIDPNDWIFLTGDSLDIQKVSKSLGYKFKQNGEEYIHPGTLITISPKGKVSRYIYGTSYNPFDVKMALIDAKAGKTNPTISKVLQFCFSYDPEGRAYTLNITRIVGAAMLLGVGLFAGILILKKKKD